MTASGVLAGVAIQPPTPPPAPAPWWAHLAVGALLLILGVVLLVTEGASSSLGLMLTGAGAGVLGIGGAAASWGKWGP